MVAADSNGNSKGQGKLVQTADAGVDSAKAALAAVTSAVNPQKVILLVMPQAPIGPRKKAVLLLLIWKGGKWHPTSSKGKTCRSVSFQEANAEIAGKLILVLPYMLSHVSVEWALSFQAR